MIPVLSLRDHLGGGELRGLIYSAQNLKCLLLITNNQLNCILLLQNIMNK